MLAFDQVRQLAGDRPVLLRHGAARGADMMMDAAARRLGWEVKSYPADWDAYGRSAGHRRNAQMVADGADLCLAFPLGESRGTRGCMRVAAQAGISVFDCTSHVRIGLPLTTSGSTH